jgi:DegV family protein with EDD domain
VDCVKRGLSLDDTVRIVQALIEKVRVEFIIETVEYLHKGGRCSGLQMLLSSLLEIHPIIRVTGGEILLASKIRGNRQVVLRKLVKNTLNNLDSINPERIFITHIGASEDAFWINSQFTQLNKFKQILIMNTNCVISTHCGPRTIGIAYLGK